MSEPADQLQSTISELIAQRFGVSSDAVAPTTRFDGVTLDADSLDMVEIAEAVDATLDVYIPDEELEAVETVGDLTAYIRDVV